MNNVKKIDRNLNIDRADNGYVVEFNYRDNDDDYKRGKQVFDNLDSVIAFLKIVQDLPLDD